MTTRPCALLYNSISARAQSWRTFMSLRRRQPRAQRPLRCCTSFSKHTSIARAWTVRDGARTAADARAATSYDRRGAPYKDSTT